MFKAECIFLIFFALLFVSVEAQTRQIKIMAANLTSGSEQKYEEPGIRILQAFKPDICGIQEFNYDGSIDNFVFEAFGPDYHYYREPYHNDSDIPNGIIY